MMHSTCLPSPNKSTAAGRSSTRAAHRSGAGFTLPELLVVIAILAVLASLATVGVMRAMDTARQTRMKIEIDNIDTALKAYKEQYGSYPPCDLRDPANNAPLRAHVARAFPRYNINNLPGDLAVTGLDLMNFRPDQALVFWLRGFSPDVTNPFRDMNGRQIVNGATTGLPLYVPALFEFGPDRLMDLSGSRSGATFVEYPSYVPQGVKNNAPYVYFDGATLNNAFNQGLEVYWSPAVSLPLLSSVNYARAYFQDENGNRIADLNQLDNSVPPGMGDPFVNMDSFQLFATGLDGQYSNVNMAAQPQTIYPEGTPYDTLYDDNVASFTDRARLGDAKP